MKVSGKSVLRVISILLLWPFGYQGIQANPNQFSQLDSTFRANAGLYGQEELEALIFELRSNARAPLELGKMELHNSTYHLKGARIGLALIACQRAVAIFDSLDVQEMSLRALIQEAGLHRKLGDMTSVAEVLTRVMRLARDLPDGELRCKALRLQGAYAIDRGQLDSAHIWIRPAIRMAEQAGDPVLVAGLRYVDAVAYQLQGKQKAALKILREIEPGILATPDYAMQAQYYNFYGMVHMSVEDNTAAVETYRKALKIAQDQRLRWHEGMILNSLAIGQRALGDTVSAIQNHQAALDIAMELNQVSNISSICSGLADIYIGLKEWDLAEDYARKGLQYARQAQLLRMESYALIRIAMVDMQRENYVHALDQLTLADSLTRPSGNWTRIRDINEMRAEASEKLGQMEAALHYQRLATSAQDSIEYKEVKMYADSLKYSQPLIVQTKPEEGKRKREEFLWLLLVLGAIGGIAWLVWRFRNGVRETEETLPDAIPVQEVSPADITATVEALKRHKNWSQFMLQFDRIYPGLMQSMALRHPDLTPTDVRVLALSRLGLSADETGEILGISTESAKKARYRTRKRLGLAAGQSLLQYMLQG